MDIIDIPDGNIENLYVARHEGRDYFKVYRDGVPSIYTPTGEKPSEFTSICPKGFERSACLNDVPEWVELQFEHEVDRYKDHPFTQVKGILFDTDDYSDGESSVDIATYTNLSYISGSFIELTKETIDELGIK